MPENPQLMANILAQPAALRQVVAGTLSPGGRKTLREATRLVLKAEQAGASLVLCGIGASLCACYPAAEVFGRLGLTVVVEDAAELLHYHHLRYGEEAVFVLVSRSGETIEMTRLLDVLAGRAVIGLTNVPGSRLEKASRQALRMNSPADQLVAIQTYLATLAVLRMLAASYEGNLETTAERIQALSADLEVRVPAWAEASASWKPFFEGLDSLYTLGRGPALGSALEAQLLFHEIARQPATAMGAGHFRHGPWEVVEAGFGGIVFAPPGATQGLNFDLAGSIQALNGRVCLVSPELPAGLVPDLWWQTPAVEEDLAPLAEIIPAQLAAYRRAVWRGLTPGSFRASGQVTTAETGLTKTGG